jgi:hypothetical protein
MYKEKLAAIALNLLNAKQACEEVEASRLLSGLLENMIGSGNELPCIETQTPGGIALSPMGAADCVDDAIRSARFIKGIYLAIRELQRRFPGEKINILYAGCGPYATLLLPLLPLFSDKELAAILLDIDPYSVGAVKAVFKDTGLEKFLLGAFLEDAASYKYPEGQRLHLVISETMFRGLIREPQVAITANLAPQLCPSGILIPEEVRIDLVWTTYVKEPFWKNHTDPEQPLFPPGLAPQRIDSGSLFVIRKSDNFFKASDTFSSLFQFESSDLKIPENKELYPDLCLFTSLKIFGDIYLRPAESLITNPTCLASVYNLTEKKNVRLRYCFKEMPDWTIIM